MGNHSNMKTSITTVIIAGLVIYILYLTQCNKPQLQPNQSVLSVDTQAIIKKYQAMTSPRIDTVYRPGQFVYRHDTIRGKPETIFVETIPEVPANIDTQAILEGYYSKVIQTDSLKTPDVSIHLTDTVYKNRIIGRLWGVQAVSRTVVKTITPRTVYFGGGFHYAPSDVFSDVHVDLGYINRKGQHFKVDLKLENKQLQYGGSFYQTIFRFK